MITLANTTICVDTQTSSPGSVASKVAGNTTYYGVLCHGWTVNICGQAMRTQHLPENDAPAVERADWARIKRASAERRLCERQ